MEQLASPAYWQEIYDQMPLTYREEEVLFQEIFLRYLPHGGRCFEVGCYPGNFLIYLGKNFGYEVNGIDQNPLVLTRMARHFSEHGIRVGRLVHGDFLHEQVEQDFDLVCSFGFIEHFSDYAAVIERHVDLVKPGGFLILSTPNYRYFQGLLHRFLNPEDYKIHNIKAMALRRWQKILQQAGMKVIYKNYYRTAGFWGGSPWPTGRRRLFVIDLIRRISFRINRRFNWPNPLFSPYMICLAQKPYTSDARGAGIRGAICCSQ